MKTLIVTPTYNEADNLPVLVEQLSSILSADVHLLIVDDNSPDGTGDIAEALAEADPERFHVLHRQAKEGLGRAYVAGFCWALARGYNFVVEMDADLSHNPADVPALLAAARAGADVVIGSRYVNGISVINWPLRRILLSLGANEYVRKITGIPVHDATSGFRVYSARALESLDLLSIRSSGYSFQVEMTYRAHLRDLRIEEVAIVFTERRAGLSKMNHRVVAESALMPWLLKLRLHRGLRPERKVVRPEASLAVPWSGD